MIFFFFSFKDTQHPTNVGRDDGEGCFCEEGMEAERERELEVTLSRQLIRFYYDFSFPHERR